jgi:hypothetical protein
MARSWQDTATGNPEIESFKFTAAKQPLNFWDQDAAGGH